DAGDEVTRVRADLEHGGLLVVDLPVVAPRLTVAGGETMAVAVRGAGGVPARGPHERDHLAVKGPDHDPLVATQRARRAVRVRHQARGELYARRTYPGLREHRVQPGRGCALGQP